MEKRRKRPSRSYLVHCRFSRSAEHSSVRLLVFHGREFFLFSPFSSSLTLRLPLSSIQHVSYLPSTSSRLSIIIALPPKAFSAFTWSVGVEKFERTIELTIRPRNDRDLDAILLGLFPSYSTSRDAKEVVGKLERDIFADHIELVPVSRFLHPSLSTYQNHQKENSEFIDSLEEGEKSVGVSESEICLTQRFGGSRGEHVVVAKAKLNELTRWFAPTASSTMLQFTDGRLLAFECGPLVDKVGLDLTIFARSAFCKLLEQCKGQLVSPLGCFETDSTSRDFVSLARIAARTTSISSYSPPSLSPPISPEPPPFKQRIKSQEHALPQVTQVLERARALLAKANTTEREQGVNSYGETESRIAEKERLIDLEDIDKSEVEELDDIDKSEVEELDDIDKDKSERESTEEQTLSDVMTPIETMPGKKRSSPLHQHSEPDVDLGDEQDEDAPELEKAIRRLSILSNVEMPAAEREDYVKKEAVLTELRLSFDLAELETPEIVLSHLGQPTMDHSQDESEIDEGGANEEQAFRVQKSTTLPSILKPDTSDEIDEKTFRTRSQQHRVAFSTRKAGQGESKRKRASCKQQ